MKPPRRQFGGTNLADAEALIKALGKLAEAGSNAKAGERAAQLTRQFLQSSSATEIAAIEDWASKQIRRAANVISDRAGTEYMNRWTYILRCVLDEMKRKPSR